MTTSQRKPQLGIDLARSPSVTGLLLVMPTNDRSRDAALRQIETLLDEGEGAAVASQMRALLDAAPEILTIGQVGAQAKAPREKQPAAPKARPIRRRLRGDDAQPAVLDNSRESLTGGPSRLARHQVRFSTGDDLRILAAGAEGDEGLARLARTMGLTEFSLRARYKALVAETSRELTR